MTGKPIIYEELTAIQVKEMIDGGMDMAIMPIGATEQHGPHLPLNVDTLIPDRMAREVSAESGIPVFPSFAYGQSSSHAGFPATLSLRPETFQKVMEEIGEWAYETGFRRLVFLNGNLPNHPPLTCAILNLRIKFPDFRLRVLNWWDITPQLSKRIMSDSTCGFPHGNVVETSVMRYLRDDLVDMAQATEVGGRDRSVFFFYLLKQISQSGHCGDPSVSTKELGEELYRMAVDAMVPMVKAALTEEPPGY